MLIRRNVDQATRGRHLVRHTVEPGLRPAGEKAPCTFPREDSRSGAADRAMNQIPDAISFRPDLACCENTPQSVRALVPVVDSRAARPWGENGRFYPQNGGVSEGRPSPARAAGATLTGAVSSREPPVSTGLRFGSR
jgi:hypothetical protein